MPTTDRDTDDAAPQVDGVARHHRTLQVRAEATRDSAPPERAAVQSDVDEQGVQAGARTQPRELPAQHLAKPGLDAELELAPRFMAPDYRGSGKLEGMATLITGADSGIGRAVAVLFAREGADVALLYLNEHEDARETQRCVEAEGRRCLLIAGDVKDPAFCRSAVEQTVVRFGKLDVLVNNAAFQEHVDSIDKLSEAQFNETWQTNVGGYFHMAKAAMPHLGQGASIINTGSVVGLEGSARLLNYASTKGAIHAFTKSLALNLVDKSIRVNAVAPGPVWTPLNPADRDDDDVNDFGKHADMKRVAQPEEISPAYVFLASPVCSGYITGIVLPVTGSVGAI